jgi:hypothetical protein
LLPDDPIHPPVILQRVPDPKIVKTRVHIDGRVDDVETKASELEAKRIDVAQPSDATFIPMADPRKRILRLPGYATHRPPNGSLATREERRWSMNAADAHILATPNDSTESRATPWQKRTDRRFIALATIQRLPSAVRGRRTSRSVGNSRCASLRDTAISLARRMFAAIRNVSASRSAMGTDCLPRRSSRRSSAGQAASAIATLDGECLQLAHTDLKEPPRRRHAASL